MLLGCTLCRLIGTRMSDKDSCYCFFVAPDPINAPVLHDKLLIDSSLVAIVAQSE